MSESEELSQSAQPQPMSDMAQQIAALSADRSAQEIEDLNSHPGLEADIDVPESTFWDNQSSNDEPSIEVEDTYAPELNQTIKFKAFGQEKELSFEEAGRRLGMPADIIAGLPTEAVQTALSKVEGGNLAFTKLAQANQRVQELETSVPELQKKAQLLDKLESVKHDWKKIIEIATGKNPDQFLKEAMRKQRIIELGSDQEIQQLQKEERLESLERELEAQRQQQADLAKKESERSYNSEKSELGSLLQGEFFKHKFDMGNEIDSNEVNEMLWDQSRARMTKYVQKYKDHPKFKELLPKMAQKSFEDVAGKLNRLTTGQVQAKVDEAIRNKKQQAQEKAAIASTRRIGEPNVQDFTGLSVRQIADKLIGKNKFSF